MEFETYTQQAYEYLYKPCLATLNQNQLPLSHTLYNCTQYTLIEVICPSSSHPKLLPSYLSYLFNALGSLGLTIAYIVQVTPEYIKTYFALQHPQHIPVGIDILFQSLESLNLDLKFNIIQHAKVLIDKLFFSHDKNQTLCTASLIPNPSKSDSLFSNLVSLLPQETYTFMLLAEPIPRPCYLQFSQYLSKLYFNLSRFREITFSDNKSTTYTDSNACSKTCTQNESSALSQTNTDANTHNSSQTRSTSITVSNKINDKISLSNNASNSCNTGDNSSHTNAVSNNSSSQNTDSDSCNHSKTCTTVESSGTNARALQSEVIHLIEQLDLIFTRLRTTQNLSMFNFCTYFFAPTPSTCMRAAFNYAGLSSSELFPLSTQYVNTWLPHSPFIQNVITYLKCFHHPIFFTATHCDYITPTFPISSLELASALGLCSI